MDQLDRLFHRLVHNIRSRDAGRLSVPFTVGELYEQIVPYRHNRRELGIETNQEYELTVMRLLSGERGYLLGDSAVQEALRRSLESPDPDPAAFREHAGAEVSISPAALDQVRGAGRRATAAPAPEAKAPAHSVTAESIPSPDAALAAEPPTVADGTPAGATAGVHHGPRSLDAEPEPATDPEPATEPDKTSCRFCGTALPEAREVKFCPNCGQNLAISRCPACGGEIEAGWKFCITCGRPAGS